MTHESMSDRAALMNHGPAFDNHQSSGPDLIRNCVDTSECVWGPARSLGRCHLPDRLRPVFLVYKPIHKKPLDLRENPRGGPDTCSNLAPGSMLACDDPAYQLRARARVRSGSNAG